MNSTFCGEVLTSIRGLKFPDLYVTKFFFKEKLHLKESKGKVLELGCGNGNNLILFRAYGYETIGIDVDKKAIEDANYNFKLLFGKEGYHFVESNFLKFPIIKEFLKEPLDVLLIPNSLNYVRREDFFSLLKFLKDTLKGKLKIFLRFRSPRDSRVCCGEPLGKGEFLIKTDITGEKGQILTVYEENEMVFLLREFLNLSNYKVFHLYEENLHSGIKVLNADIVLWGDIEL